MQLRDFLAQYADTLLEQVRGIRSIGDGQDDAPYRAKAEELSRKPYEKQMDTVLSLVHGFSAGRNALFLTAEMGTGKTMMAITTAYLVLPERSRVIVLCPSHLVSKWMREIQITIPGTIVHDLGEWSLTALLNLRHTPCQGREFYILGKEKAKLSYVKADALWEQKHLGRLLCPDCGTMAGTKKRRETRCENCGTVFWQADNTRLRRCAIADVIQRKFPGGFFDLFIADEVHQYKSGQSAQGNAFAYLANRSRKVLCLTGTLMGGYSSNLFYLMWRLMPGKMLDLLGESRSPGAAEKRFVESYGVIERTIKRSSDGDILGVASIARRNDRSKVIQKEKPGISPVIFTDFLLERSAFLRLQDIAANLPAYTEHVVSVPMDQEQEDAYKRLEQNLTQAVKLAVSQGSMRLLGAMLQSLMAYPDGCRRGETVIDPQNGSVIADAPMLDIQPLPKEEKLIEIVREEVAAGRRCLVYVEHTGTRDLIPDLERLLEQAGFRVAALRSTTVKAGEREAWINRAVKTQDVDVLICNPRLVETGLDLIDFPSIIFFQTGYSVFTLRQASRRSWRIGQQQPVKVYYLAYEHTLQAKALGLMANKMQVALMVEGELSDSGLTALADGESSIMVELAKTLIENSQVDVVGEWIQLKRTQLVMNGQISRRRPVTQQTTVTVSDGESTERVLFEEVLRGYVYLKGKKAVAVVDGKYTFEFSGGVVYFGKKPVGSYGKDGRGEINRKPIRLVRDRANRWLLYEQRIARAA